VRASLAAATAATAAAAASTAAVSQFWCMTAVMMPSIHPAVLHISLTWHDAAPAW
jgi:hypothetical protein